MEKFLNYLAKMRGDDKSHHHVKLVDIAWSLFGSAVGVGVCAYLSASYFEPRDSNLLIGSFGASAVLLYAAIESPLAQPRNVIGGHVISALVGVAAFQLFGGTLWLAATMSVSLAIAAMLATNTVHPPGGATALIAVIGGDEVHNLGFTYALTPVGAGATILLIVAVLINNLAEHRKYPKYWF